MNNSFNQLIGARLREQREFLGLTRENVSNFVNISPQFLSEVERGKKGVSAEMLCRLCNGLGVSADYILTGKERSADTTRITALLTTLDKKYIPLAEEMLKTFFKTISLK